MSFQSLPRISSVPLPDYWPFLTFGDVDFEIKSRSQVGLFERGCLLADGSHNCTKVCLDKDLLFGNIASEDTKSDPVGSAPITNAMQWEQVPYNIHNCMLYPYISATLNNKTAIATDHQAAQALAGYFEISPNLNSTYGSGGLTLWRNISQVQWSCAEKFCTSGTACGDGLTVDDFSRDRPAAQTGPGLPIRSGYDFPRWSAISPRDSMFVYSEVAGIGVAIAFRIQAAVIGMCFVYLWVKRYRDALHDKSNIGLRAYQRNLLKLVPIRILPKGLAKYVSGLNTRLSPDCSEEQVSTRQIEGFHTTILGAMNAFQSAQHFFLLSMNIALLLGFLYKGPFMGSQSLGQHWNNVLYMQMVAQGSIAFSTFTQYILHSTNQGSLYYLVLTLANFAFGTTTFTLSRQYLFPKAPIRLEVKVADPRIDGWQRSCGMVSPQTYNGISFRTSQIVRGLPVVKFQRFGYWILALGSIVILGLAGSLVWRLYKSLTSLYLQTGRNNVAARLIRREKDKVENWHQGQSRYEKWYKWAWFVFCLLTELSFWGWIIAFILLFWMPMTQFIPRNWTLGQILSVSIWVPGCIDWAHAGLKLCKPRMKRKLATWLDARSSRGGFAPIEGQDSDRLLKQGGHPNNLSEDGIALGSVGKSPIVMVVHSETV